MDENTLLLPSFPTVVPLAGAEPPAPTVMVYEVPAVRLNPVAVR
jgi:hypothetical protein